jgi:hypothetical protein
VSPSERISRHAAREKDPRERSIFSPHGVAVLITIPILELLPRSSLLRHAFLGHVG